MDKLSRIDKILSNMGEGSRHDIKLKIKNGAVSIDGEVCREAGRRINPENTVICLDGRRLAYREFVYIMLNKSAGYLSATEDKSAATVMDLLKEPYRSMELFPAGRLDKDSEGLLLLTNDGELTHKILSPKNHVDKLYYIKYDGEFLPGSAQKFEEGLLIDENYKCMPAHLNLCGAGEAYITIKEGKYHQVKRMAMASGAEVTYLKRIAMGNLTLDDRLPCGEYRLLSEEEEANLINTYKNDL